MAVGERDRGGVVDLPHAVGVGDRSSVGHLGKTEHHVHAVLLGGGRDLLHVLATGRVAVRAPHLLGEDDLHVVVAGREQLVDLGVRGVRVILPLGFGTVVAGEDGLGEDDHVDALRIRLVDVFEHHVGVRVLVAPYSAHVRDGGGRRVLGAVAVRKRLAGFLLVG